MKNGKFLQGIETMETLVAKKLEMYGESSVEFQKSSAKLCEQLNMAAMILLQKNSFDATLEFLKKAERLSQSSHRLKATTFNNMACYYRRIGKIRTALNYLISALDIENKL